MATFNPTAEAPTDEGGAEQATVNENLPSGDYLLRIVWFGRQVGKESGKEYLRVKYEILAGEFTRNAFFANLSCNVQAGGVASRWRSICTGLGITESFEVHGTQGDKDFARLFKGRPFKARVNRSTSGEYVNYDIAKTYTKESWTENEQSAVKAMAEVALGESSAPATAPKDDDDIPF